MKKFIIILTVFIFSLMLLLVGPWIFHKDRVATEAKVGVFYYPWYSNDSISGHNNWHSQVFRETLDPAHEVRLGEYSSKDSQVIGQHIDWSVEGNISVWVTSWWGPGEYTDIVLKDYILTHPKANQLEYAILYESQGRLGEFNNPDFSNLYTDMAYLSENYFNHPQYLKINGKPVIYIYLSREYFKGDNLKELEKLKNLYPNLYVIGDDLFIMVNTPGKSGLLDGVNSYDVYGQSFAGGNNGSTRFELWKLSLIYRIAFWQSRVYGYDFIPSIAPGYNDRAVREGHLPAPRKFNNNSEYGDVFTKALQRAAFPYLSPGSENLLLITSFNEWYEDTQIEPTKGVSVHTSKDISDSGYYYTQRYEYEDYGTRYLEILSDLTTGP